MSGEEMADETPDALWQRVEQATDPDHYNGVRCATGLRAVLLLHKPYWSVPLEIASGPMLTVDGRLAAEDWREASEFEQITGGRWWCDECRKDAPCPTFSAVLDSVAP